VTIVVDLHLVKVPVDPVVLVVAVRVAVIVTVEVVVGPHHVNALTVAHALLPANTLGVDHPSHPADIPVVAAPDEIHRHRIAVGGSILPLLVRSNHLHQEIEETERVERTKSPANILNRPGGTKRTIDVDHPKEKEEVAMMTSVTVNQGAVTVVTDLTRIQRIPHMGGIPRENTRSEGMIGETQHHPCVGPVMDEDTAETVLVDARLHHSC